MSSGFSGCRLPRSSLSPEKAQKFDLSDGQIADVVNDLNARWNPGAPTVAEETVRRIRDETASQKLFPTAKELNLSD